MIDILFFTIAVLSALGFASTITLLSTTVDWKKQTIWILKPMFVAICSIAMLTMLMGCFIMYIDRKPAPKVQYEQVTEPLCHKIN